MTQVKVSPKYQIVIPADVRSRLKIKPGQKLCVFEFAGRIELVPVEPPANLRGFLGDIDTTVDRDEDRV